MTGAQHAVLWIGFFLIIVQMLTTSQWSVMWATLKGSGTAGAPAPASGAAPGKSATGNRNSGPAGVLGGVPPVGFLPV